MVESDLAVAVDLHHTSFRKLYPLIIPPLTLTSDLQDLIFITVMLVLMGTLLFHEMTKRGMERWKSPTVPMLFCILMIVSSLIAAKFLSLV